MRGGVIIKKEKNAPETARKLARGAGYPEDALFDEPGIQLIGRSSASVEGCRAVLLCSEERMCFDMGGFTASFFGERMQIEELSRTYLSLSGKITSLALDAKGE